MANNLPAFDEFEDAPAASAPASISATLPSIDEFEDAPATPAFVAHPKQTLWDQAGNVVGKTADVAEWLGYKVAPKILGAGAAALAFPTSGPVGSAAAFAATDEALQAGIRYLTGKEAFTHEQGVDAIANLAASLAGAKLIPGSAQMFRSAAQKLSGTSLKGLLGILVHAAGGAIGAGVTSVGANTIAGRPVTVSGTAIDSAFGGGMEGLGQFFKTGMRNAPGTPVTQKAQDLGMRGPDGLIETTLEAPGSSKHIMARNSASGATEGINAQNQRVVSRSVEATHPKVEIDSHDPLSQNMNPTPSAPEVLNRYQDTSAILRGNIETRRPPLAQPTPMPLTAQAGLGRDVEKSASTKFAQDLIAINDPSLPSTAQGFAAPAVSVAETAKKAVGAKFDTMVKAMMAQTGGKPIPVIKVGTAALGMMDLLSEQIKPDSRLFKIAKNLADKTTSSKSFNAQEMSDTISELKDISRAIGNPKASGAVDRLARAMEDDLEAGVMAYAKVSADPNAVPATKAVLSAFKTAKEQYRTAHWTQEALEHATIGERVDAGKAVKYIEENLTEMPPKVRGAMIAKAEEFSRGAESGMIKASAGDSTDLFKRVLDGDEPSIRHMQASQALEDNVVDQLLTKGNTQIQTGSSEKVPLDVADSTTLRKFLKDKPTFMSKLSQQSQDRINDFLDNPDNRSSQRSDEFLRLSNILEKDNPAGPYIAGKIGSGVSPQALEQVKQIVLANHPEVAKAFGSLAMRETAAKGGEVNPRKLLEYLYDLKTEGVMGGAPTRKMLQATHTPEQYKVLSKMVDVLENLDEITSTLPASQQRSAGSELRTGLTSPLSAGKAQASEFGGGAVAKATAALAFVSQATLIPHLMRYLTSRNFDDTARNTVQTIASILKSRQTSSVGERRRTPEEVLGGIQ